MVKLFDARKSQHANDARLQNHVWAEAEYRKEFPPVSPTLVGRVVMMMALVCGILLSHKLVTTSDNVFVMVVFSLFMVLPTAVAFGAVLSRSVDYVINTLR